MAKVCLQLHKANSGYNLAFLIPDLERQRGILPAKNRILPNKRYIDGSELESQQAKICGVATRSMTRRRNQEATAQNEAWLEPNMANLFMHTEQQQAENSDEDDGPMSQESIPEPEMDTMPVGSIA